MAFFFEAAFIGIWIFGWDRLPKALHLASIWCVSAGTIMSAYFIIVGERVHAAPGRLQR
ncbi:cytochrome ubiquinol oxidase subunit I [Curtobacterium flaccumfaciens]|nr:cytochrome ubiquinol oxidase subunit I [Curtobacterium flaccumfaciens]